MSTKHEIIERLRERVGAIVWDSEHPVISYGTGVREIDLALKHGGIVAGSCHEIISEQQGPALGFALYLLSSMSRTKGPILWCSDRNDFYTPGFIPFGLNDSDVIFVESANPQHCLWAMEQGLSCTEIAAVVLDVHKISLAQARRLKLLAKTHNTVGILMMKPKCAISTSIAATRWSVSAQRSLGAPSRYSIKCVGAPRLLVKLLRNQGGHAPLSWEIEFDEKTLRFHSVSQLLSPATKHHRAASLIGSRQGTA